MPVPLLTALGCGVVSALLYLSVLSGAGGSVILGYLAPLPVFLAGLSFGAGSAVIAGGVGMAVVMVGPSSMTGVGTYLATAAVPAVLVVWLASQSRTDGRGGTEWYPPGRLLVVLVGLGLAGLVVAGLVAQGEGGFRGVVEAMLAGVMTELVRPVAQDNRESVESVAKALASLFPAVLAMSWLLMVVANAALAQGLLMRIGRNLRPAMRMADLEIPERLVMLLAVVGVGALVLPDELGYVAANAVVVLVVPYFFAGLAVVHAFAATRPGKMGLLLVFYSVLLLFAVPVPVVIALGLAEHWTGLRRRFVAAGALREG
ncbi:Predicted membrane protein [uncultured Gammaproteobacteria bacterium]